MDKVEIKKVAIIAREVAKESSLNIPNFEEYINHFADKRDFEFFLKERDKIVKYVENLKSQLKESEEKCHEQWLEIQAETHQIQMLEQEKERIRKNWQISKTHQQKLYNNLKQQNKAKGIVNYPVTLDGCRIANEEQLLDFAKDFCLEKKYWEKQLAEKEIEIERLKQNYDEVWEDTYFSVREDFELNNNCNECRRCYAEEFNKQFAEKKKRIAIRTIEILKSVSSKTYENASDGSEHIVAWLFTPMDVKETLEYINREKFEFKTENQTAIAELEKVKEFVENEKDYQISTNAVLLKIDQQIAELKGEK